ncbi:MAG: hypothetical protein E7439_02685 [Ruminococcaceae bacterium]|nr:hypothetical protein [Oscillospiraceae bacterium]
MENKKPKTVKIVLFAALAVLLVSAIVLSAIFYFTPLFNYNSAKKLIEAGSYAEAYEKLQKYPQFLDTEDLLPCFIIKYEQKDVKYCAYLNNSEYVSNERYAYVFDEAGNCIRITYQNVEEGTTFCSEYTYDESGRKLTAVEAQYDLTGSLTFKETHTYEYHENGSRCLYAFYDSSGILMSSDKSEYDKDGNEIFHAHYTSTGELVFTNEYVYDAEGNCTLTAAYDQNGVLEFKDEFSYVYVADSIGRVIQQTCYSIDGAMLYKDTYAYENSMLVSTAHYDGNGVLEFSEAYTYNAAGQLTLSLQYDYQGNLHDKLENTYDENGNILLTVHYGSDGKLMEKYEYSYGGKIVFFNPNSK